ncbi:MAG TPA: amino acid adenylation domain-containing protein, partial [Candidatus Angelobacter sp.]
LNHEVIAEAPGLLVRYLPVWVDVNLQTPLREMVDKVAAATSEAMGWQQFFDWKQIESAEPIPILRWCFESCSIDESMGGEGIYFRIAGVWGISDGFAQRLVVQERRGSGGHVELGGEIDYDATGMRPQEAQWLAEELATVVEGALAKPEAAIDALPIIGPMQREMLYVWNQTKGEYAREKCVHELFEEQVERTPDVVAVAYGEEQVSYAQLNRRANRLAHYLISLGVEPDDRVAICVERGLEMVIGILGILKAGAAYVPLDPSYPAERLQFMVEDSGPVVVMTQESLRGMVEEIGDEMRVVELGVVMNRAEDGEEERNPGELGRTSQNLCYVIYTSGSTGTPKGVMVEHRALLNHMEWMQREFRYGPDDRILQRTPISFDASVWEFFAPLLCGGKLVLLGSEVHADVESLRAILKKDRITVVGMVPMLLAALVEVGGIAAAEELRLVCCGGELLKTELVERSLRQKHVEIVNLYGPTEATIDATYWRGIKVLFGAGVPIGRPILNTQVHVLDRQGEAVPVGVVGEIYIGGTGLGRGYLKRAEVTAERFVPDPYAEETGARMYRTGDLGRWLEDGNIEFVGRNDDQVKIRGYRIELGEIEARLAEHEQVREEVVVVREDENGEKRLVAYVVAESETDAGELAGRLRAYLVSRLPEYMVPAAYVQLEVMPLTPNGKLDRKALPEPEGTGHAQRMYEAPRGEIEEKLAVVWQELLGVKQVGRQDNFFELGGHSLLAVQLVERLRRLDLQIEVRALFTTPVLSELAATLDNYREAWIPPVLIAPGSTVITPEMLPLIDVNQEEIDQIVERIPGGIANIQDIYALSPLQEGVLFHHLMAVQGDPYIVSTQIAFPDRMLLDRFLSAVQQVVDRHDILRTCFMWQGLSQPAQVVLRRAQIPVTEIELDAHAGPVGKQLTRHFDPRWDRMDLTQAPLLHFAIAHDAEADCWILLRRLHHMIGDRSTLNVLSAEVSDFLTGQGDKLSPPQPFRNLIATARLGIPQEEHERFFREMLGEVTEPTLPFGLVDVNQDGTNLVDLGVMLSQDLNERLRSQARRLGVSLASLCHLAWGQVLARSSGNERVVFGTVLLGRMQAGEAADEAVGMFINTLPMRLDLDDMDTEAAVHQVHIRLGQLLRHEHASLALAQRCSGIVAPSLLFSSIFNYRLLMPHVRKTSLENGTEEVDPLARTILLENHVGSNYPLTMSVEDFGQSLGLAVMVEQPLAERICGYMQQSLESLAHALESEPHMPVWQLEILPPEERQQLLEWNATEAPYRENVCLHQLFEEQVEKTPQATAVVYEEQWLSYIELNEQANRLAHYLINLGVKPDEPVGICVERGARMVIGLLGILKAGGAYVPLDPAYPCERLRKILEDAGPRMVLIDAAGREAIGADALKDVTVIDVGELGRREAQPPVWAEQPCSDPEAQTLGLTSHHLAYVIYTSGSTGKPKGVAIEHRNAANLLCWARKNFAAEETQHTLFCTSLQFDLSIYECFVPLVCGGTVHVVADALSLIHQPQAVSLVNTVPSAIASVLEHGGVPSSTCTVNLAGEPLKAVLIRRLLEQSQVRRVCNLYGPTETTTYSTWMSMERGGEVLESIGRPIANTKIYLLDGKQRPVPLGAVGEIYIGGAGVARGYLNRPELTAERFVRDPFTRAGEGRMYRTGDLGRYLADGNIEFLGRND